MPDALDRKIITIGMKHYRGVHLPIKKAFDTISHIILISKLHHYSMRGLAYDWLTKLSNRLQYVKIVSICSDMSSVVCGLPQGSILEPLLNLIYVN